MSNPEDDLDGLLRHHQAYGLDNSHRSTKRYTHRYGSAKQLLKDSLVETGIRSLGPKAFRLLIEGIGYREFADACVKEWHDLRGLDEEDDS